MHPFWQVAIKPALDAAGADTVVEVGVEQGRTTALLLDRARERGRGVVHGIDPMPRIDISAWGLEYGNTFQLHVGRSHDVLGRIGAVDAALIDGDHNYFTVLGELQLLARTASDAEAPLPLVVAHDTGWPYGRRDLYYDPNSIPYEHRHTAQRAGLLPGRAEPGTPGINGALWNAVPEGGARNGVLTAIEDFAGALDGDCRMVTIPGFHGLTLLATAGRLEAAPELATEFDRLDSAGFLREWAGVLERARIETGISAGAGAGAAPVQAAPQTTASGQGQGQGQPAHPADRDLGLLD